MPLEGPVSQKSCCGSITSWLSPHSEASILLSVPSAAISTAGCDPLAHQCAVHITLFFLLSCPSEQPPEYSPLVYLLLSGGLWPHPPTRSLSYEALLNTCGVIRLECFCAHSDVSGGVLPETLHLQTSAMN